VFLIWAVDGWFPMSRALGSDEEIEEERRLMYVAMTRARDHLAVVHPFNVYETRRGANYNLAQLSRFLDRGVVRAFQQVVLETAPEPPPEAAPAAPIVDVRAMLRARFDPDAPR
jgi:DNA helicase-2/ATP-dependent DNA helicase PcrA